MTVTEPCVSLTPGTLSPDLRVNYAFGMVLGVDEFRQEQFHQQEKDNLLNRALHGYGIVSGLDVSVAPADGDVNNHDQDFIATVGTGIGVDQWGREFVIRSPQCASVGAWMADQERAQPGILDAHALGSGELMVYVVASYSTCLDNAVPVPGQPCSSSGQTTVASRVRDAWNIDFRLDPPAMPRWDADLRFQRLLQSVRIGNDFDGLLPGEEALFAAVRALPAQTGFIDDGTNVGKPAYVIRVDRANETLDQAFRIWIDEVRPALEPDLISPAETSDPAILLGALTAEPNRPFNLDGVTFGNVFTFASSVRRPYLLHTGLAQQLAETGSTGDPFDPVQAVTLSPSLSSTGVLTISATFHLFSTVRLTGGVIVIADSNPFPMPFDVTPGEASGQTWTLTAPADAPAWQPGDALTVYFDVTSVIIEGTTITDWRSEHERPIVNLGLRSLTAFTNVPAAAVAVTDAPFVTITSYFRTDQSISWELWFHPRPQGTKDDLRVKTPNIHLYDELSGTELQVTSLEQDPTYGNVWHLSSPIPGLAGPVSSAYLRFVFPLDEFTLTTSSNTTVTLASVIDQSGVGFTGYDREAARIVSFARDQTGSIVKIAGNPASEAAKTDETKDETKNAPSKPRSSTRTATPRRRQTR